MSYQEVLARRVIAISISESPDMPALGLSEEHLRDAMAEIARHLLALGARLIYGGDLRRYGFSELLLELVARHRRDVDDSESQTGVTSYLAWPVHVMQSATIIRNATADLEGSAELVCLRLDGSRLPMAERQRLESHQPTESEWLEGLTALRQTIVTESDAKIVLGGRVDKYKGVMPGIAEEALLTLQSGQPLYLMGGFGGCARDLAETLGLVAPWGKSPRAWTSRPVFQSYSVKDLNNGLTAAENTTLAQTPHVDQAVSLILRGLMRTADRDTTL